MKLEKIFLIVGLAGSGFAHAQTTTVKVKLHSIQSIQLAKSLPGCAEPGGGTIPPVPSSAAFLPPNFELREARITGLNGEGQTVTVVFGDYGINQSCLNRAVNTMRQSGGLLLKGQVNSPPKHEDPQIPVADTVLPLPGKNPGREVRLIFISSCEAIFPSRYSAPSCPERTPPSPAQGQ